MSSLALLTSTFAQNLSLSKSPTAKKSAETTSPDQSDFHNAPIPAAHRVFAIPELLEQILLFCPTTFILYHAHYVAPFWCHCIQGSTRLKRKIYLSAEPLREDNDPHFASQHVSTGDASYAHRYTGDNVFPLRKLRKNFFGSKIDHTEYVQVQHWIRTHSQLWPWPAPAPTTWTFGAMLSALCDIMPPEEYCRFCQHVHDCFRFENLHPILRSVDDIRVSPERKYRPFCITGYGRHLIIQIGTNRNYANKADEFTTLAGYLISRIWELGQDKHGTIVNSMVARPAVNMVTLIIGGKEELEIVTNEDGVTVGEFLDLLGSMCLHAMHEKSAWPSGWWLDRWTASKLREALKELDIRRLDQS